MCPVSINIPKNIQDTHVSNSLKTYFKIVDPKSPNVAVQDNQDISGSRGLYGNHGWYQRIVQGSTTRLVRYREFDVMA